MDIDIKDPKVVRWLVAALLVVVVVPVYFMTSVLPFNHPVRKAEIAQLDTRHQELSRDLEKARLLVRNLDRVEREYQILHQQWEVAQTLLPEQNEMPALLRKITAAGQQSGVGFDMFRPNAVVNRGFYSDNPVEVVVQGGYHQTAVFLSRLANLNRIINISNLQMNQLSLPDDDDSAFSVETSMIVTAYTQGLGQGQLPADGAAQTPQQLAANASGATTPAAQAAAH